MILTNPTQKLIKELEKDLINNFRTNLHRQLKLKGWTPQRLAREIGEDGSVIRQFLRVNNTLVPSIAYICRFAGGLKIKPATLITDPEPYDD